MADIDTQSNPIEVLAVEFVESLRQGHCPTIEQYAQRHADLADDIRSLFPTIVRLEQVRVQSESSPGERCATLGPTRLARLGDLRIIREIGRGGMGIVYEAEQESLCRRVAVKVLPRQTLLDVAPASVRNNPSQRLVHGRAEAQQKLHNAIRILDELAGDDLTNPTYAHMLGLLYLEAASFDRQDDPAAAADYLDQATTIFETLDESHNDNPEYGIALCSALSAGNPRDRGLNN